ncbi:MAG: hypothetical protein ACOCUU_03655, partial [Nanoarchaeota archaeon]
EYPCYMENKQETAPIWKEYINKEVVCTIPSGTIIGKFNQPDLERNCVDFLPHLVQEADMDRVRVETEIPRRISLNFFSYGANYDIFPVNKGYTEQRAREINKRASSRGNLGFT